MKYKHIFILFCAYLAACNFPTAQSITAAPSPSPALPSASQTISSPSPSPSPSITITPSSTSSPQPTATPSPTPVPTYLVLRGKVIVDRGVCHYGPGAPYLYKYAVVSGSNLEILRRVEYGDYVEVQAIGGNNPCWVNSKYMEISGDLSNLRPVDAADVKLPLSPYYAPPAAVSATRQADQVTVTWSPILLKPGDDSEQRPYVVEAWVCQAGRFLFIPIGAYRTSIQIADQPGCAQPSRARLLAAEKHGYTRPVDIPWPPAAQ